MRLDGGDFFLKAEECYASILYEALDEADRPVSEVDVAEFASMLIPRSVACCDGEDVPGQVVPPWQ